MFKIFVEEKASKYLERLPEKLKDRIRNKLKILEEGFSYSLDIKKTERIPKLL